MGVYGVSNYRDREVLPRVYCAPKTLSTFVQLCANTECQSCPWDYKYSVHYQDSIIIAVLCTLCNSSLSVLPVATAARTTPSCLLVSCHDLHHDNTTQQTTTTTVLLQGLQPQLQQHYTTDRPSLSHEPCM